MLARARAAAAAVGGGGRIAVAIAVVVAAALAGGVAATHPFNDGGLRPDRWEVEGKGVAYQFHNCFPAAAGAAADAEDPAVGFISSLGGHGTDAGPLQLEQCRDACFDTPTCALAAWYQDSRACAFYTRDALAPGLSAADVAADVNDDTYQFRCCAGTCNDEGVTQQIGGSAGWGVARTGDPQTDSHMFLLSIAVGTCDDNIQNGDETGVDCGGVACAPCSEGDACVVDADCAGSAACLYASTEAPAGACGAAAGAAAGCTGVGIVRQVTLADGRTYLMTTQGAGGGDAVIGGTPWYILDAPATRHIATLDASCSNP